MNFDFYLYWDEAVCGPYPPAHLLTLLKSGVPPSAQIYPNTEGGSWRSIADSSDLFRCFPHTLAEPTLKHYISRFGSVFGWRMGKIFFLLEKQVYFRKTSGKHLLQSIPLFRSRWSAEEAQLVLSVLAELPSETLSLLRKRWGGGVAIGYWLASKSSSRKRRRKEPARLPNRYFPSSTSRARQTSSYVIKAAAMHGVIQRQQIHEELSDINETLSDYSPPDFGDFF